MMKKSGPENPKPRNEFRELIFAVALLSVMLLTYI
jgi:hypothetical protein